MVLEALGSDDLKIDLDLKFDVLDGICGTRDYLMGMSSMEGNRLDEGQAKMLYQGGQAITEVVVI